MPINSQLRRPIINPAPRHSWHPASSKEFLAEPTPSARRHLDRSRAQDRRWRGSEAADRAHRDARVRSLHQIYCYERSRLTKLRRPAAACCPERQPRQQWCGCWLRAARACGGSTLARFVRRPQLGVIDRARTHLWFVHKEEGLLYTRWFIFHGISIVIWITQCQLFQKVGIFAIGRSTHWPNACIIQIALDSQLWLFHRFINVVQLDCFSMPRVSRYVFVAWQSCFNILYHVTQVIYKSSLISQYLIYTTLSSPQAMHIVQHFRLLIHVSRAWTAHSLLNCNLINHLGIYLIHFTLFPLLLSPQPLCPHV